MCFLDLREVDLRHIKSHDGAAFVFAADFELGVLHQDERIAAVREFFVHAAHVGVLAAAKLRGDGRPAAFFAQDGVARGFLTGRGHAAADVDAFAFGEMLELTVAASFETADFDFAFKDADLRVACGGGGDAKLRAEIHDLDVRRVDGEAVRRFGHFGGHGAFDEAAVHLVENVERGRRLHGDRGAALKAQRGDAFDEREASAAELRVFDGRQLGTGPFAIFRLREHGDVSAVLQPKPRAEAQNDACGRGERWRKKSPARCLFAHGLFERMFVEKGLQIVPPGLELRVQPELLDVNSAQRVILNDFRLKRAQLRRRKQPFQRALDAVGVRRVSHASC